jgi:cellulose synthase (UDP-forming)
MNNEKTTIQAQPYLVDLLTRRQKWQLDGLILLWVGIVTWFFLWWWEPKHITTYWLVGFNFFVLSWNLILPGYFFFFLRRMKKPNPALEIPEEWRIAMIVTRAPSEPFSLAKKQLRAMLAQDLPHDTWLADESPDEKIIEWCREHGVFLSCRKGVDGYHNKKWPRREKCKEGNLAYFYDNWGYRDYDFVSQMDADHIPEDSTYLRKMMRGFLDPGVGYVSAPSMNDINIKDSWISRGRVHMEATMHGSLQSGYHGKWAPMCIGSHYAVRTSALKEIGGLGPELAEDHTTTYIMQAHGWRGVHSIDALAHGEGPLNFKDCMFQEFQWARSLVMVSLETTPKYFAKLTLYGKFQFIFAQSWYFLYGSFMSMAYGLAPVALATGISFTNMYYPDYLLHVTIPVISCLGIVAFLRKHNCLRPNNVPLFSWEMIFFQIARWPYVIWGLADAFLTVLRKRYVVWLVTPKETHGGGVPLRYLTPYIMIVVLCGVDLLAHMRHIAQVGYFVLTLVTFLYYVSLITIVQVMHRKERAALKTFKQEEMAELFSLSRSSLELTTNTNN